MKSEHVNAFLVAATSVLQTMCSLKLTPGTPYVKNTAFEDDSVVICIGVTGQIRGQVLLAFKNEVACDIASKMCMMTISELDELSMSALSELGNMILGNAATVLSTHGVIVDITTPSIIQGTFTIENTRVKNVCVPTTYDGDKLIEIDISLEEAV